MKHFLHTLLVLLLFQMTACERKDCRCDPPPPCIEAKIESFKLQPHAQAIIKITRPNDTLYWFVDSIVDAGEEVLDENCDQVCVADCECDGGTIVFCDESHFGFPMETIWEQ